MHTSLGMHAVVISNSDLMDWPWPWPWYHDGPTEVSRIPLFLYDADEFMVDARCNVFRHVEYLYLLIHVKRSYATELSGYFRNGSLDELNANSGAYLGS